MSDQLSIQWSNMTKHDQELCCDLTEAPQPLSQRISLCT